MDELTAVQTRQVDVQAVARMAYMRLLGARADFGTWLRSYFPDWRWDFPYLRYTVEQLQRVTDGEIDRLMVFMPPRHGKSELVTVRYMAWRLLRQPTMRGIVAAYNQTLASRFSRSIRRIVGEQMQLSDDRTAAHEWDLPDGGGLRAVGVGAGVTGFGGDLVVIDDPVKSRAEASSAAYRERVWDWYTNDLYTRLQPDAAMVLIMTRWHEDDLAGRLLAREPERWTVINLPAEAEDGDPLGRAMCEPLNAEWFGREKLAEIRGTLGNAYYALYQQRPQPLEGGLFKRDWFEIVDALPADAQVEARARYWDRAATAGGGDWTVGVRMARTRDGMYYVEDVVRGQWSPGERDRVMLQTAQMDGADVRIVIEQEPGAAGKDVIAHATRMLAGYSVKADRVTGSKELRAEPLAAQMQVGNVRVVRARWNADFVDELLAFPTGAHDDQVDAAAGAFQALSAQTRLDFFWA